MEGIGSRIEKRREIVEMIYKITNPLLVERIEPLINEIKFELDNKTIKRIIIEYLQADEGILYAEEKDGEPTGFVFATPVYYEGEDVLFIQFSYIRRGNPNTGHEFMARLKKECQERGIKRMLFITKRKPDGFIRKYKFTLDGYVLSKEVPDGEVVQV